jgi:hypothetical protein
MTYAATTRLTASRLSLAAVTARAPAFLLGLAPAPLLAVNGGYFPSSWGWSALALAWFGILGATFARVTRPTVLQLAFLSSLVLLAAWTAASLVWSTSGTETMFEVERTLVYVAGAVAVIAFVRGEDVGALLSGVLLAIVAICAYALATRLFPTGTPYQAAGGVRLSTPIGYWNGLGLLGVMGALLGAGLASRAASVAGRAAAAAAIPLVVLTQYFTLSRGAWIALFTGTAFLVVCGAGRVRIVTTLLPVVALTALVVWQASTKSALVSSGVTRAAASHDGHALLPTLVVAIAGSAAWVALLGLVTARVRIPVLAVRAAGAVMLAVAAAVLVATFVHYGSPWSLAQRGYDSFRGNTHAVLGDQTGRLFSLNNNGRIAAWKVAWHGFETQPVGGLGAGTFGEYWTQHRQITMNIQDAHNLYVETLFELGVVGLVFVAGLILIPFAGLLRARRTPAVGALAALVAFAVASFADWHWELAGVTLCAVLCGGAALAVRREPGGPGRWSLVPLVAAMALLVLSLGGVAERLALSSSAHAANSGHFARAATDARRARWLAPWSADAWKALGLAQRLSGDRRAAVASYRKAASLDPYGEDRWLDLAVVATGRTRSAALARAHALNPLDSRVPALADALEAPQ